MFSVLPGQLPRAAPQAQPPSPSQASPGGGRPPGEAGGGPGLQARGEAGGSQRQPLRAQGRRQGLPQQDAPSPGLMRQFSALLKPEHTVHGERVRQLAGLTFLV